VDKAGGSTPDTLKLGFDATGLAGGTYADTLWFTSGSLTFPVPVVLTLFDLQVTQMATDYERSYVYALHRGSGTYADAFLAFINTSTEQIERVIPVGTNPTDMAVHAAEGRLYVTNWGQPLTRVVDLNTQQELAPLALGTDVYKVNPGRAGRILVEGLDQWVGLRLIDTANGATLSSLSVREGDGESSPGGSAYYHCDNNISNASIHRYDAGTDVLAETGTSAQHPYGSRMLVASGDGTRVFWQRWGYDAALTELAQYGETIVATTLHGTLALSANHAFDAATGVPLYTMPWTSGVMTTSGDQRKLFVFDASAGLVRAIPMADIAPVPGRGLNPVPADRSVVPPPVTELRWDISPVATRYEVYFGTDSSVVAAAGHPAPEYLGSTISTQIPLQRTLELGQSLFWRVDEVGYSSLKRGPVWKFTVSPIQVTPNAVVMSMATHALVPDAGLRLDGTAPTPWTLANSQPWLSVSRASGSTPDSVTLHFDAQFLQAGVFADTLRVTAGGTTFGVPVRLTLFDLTVTQIVADPVRPYVYALHPGSGTFADAYLAFVNTHTEEVEKVIGIGKNPTDMALSAPDGRLYVTNWGQPLTRVVDLDTQREVAPLTLGTDVYRINAGRPGRIYTEGLDQWVDLRTINANTGAVLATASVREGDGESSPTGAFYYHCDNNISNASIHRYNTAGDIPIEMNHGTEHPYGSRRLVLSGDGTRLFWQSYMYDAALNQLRDFGETIYATNVHGTYAFGPQHVFDAQTGLVVYTLPFTATAMAVSGDQGKLFAFQSVTHTVQAIQFTGLVPTLDADLHILRADPTERGVGIVWSMDRPGDVLGFNVWRSGADTDESIRVNDVVLAVTTTTYTDTTARPGQLYRYRIGVLRADGEALSMPKDVTLPPLVFALRAAPNPSPGPGPVRFLLSLPHPADVRLEVFDIGGRRVRTVRSGPMTAGSYSIDWDRRDSGGAPLANGVYFCRVQAGRERLVSRVLLAR
jgi:DNA-binding beta-propeller fold protein YncE